MSNENQYFKLFANCIPVKGANRSVICDLQRSSLQLIPNDLYAILTAHKDKKIKEIKAAFNNEFDETIGEYFEFLLENELGFITDTPELFPELDTSWHEPAEINNAIIDINKDSFFDIKNVLKQLSAVNCKFVQIRFYKNIDFSTIKELVDFLEDQASIITGVDFVFSMQKRLETISTLKEIMLNSKRISTITIYNDTQEELIEIEGRYIIITKQNIDSEKHCGIISPSFFSPNIRTFTESLTNNSCLNKKVSVDTKGNIKNCPSMKENYGNINTESLLNAINKNGFKKYWKITKNEISVCRDCEFRHVCTDCRAYIETPEDEHSKPLKCGYDPYTNEWEQWSTNSLKKSAIEYYGLTELISS